MRKNCYGPSGSTITVGPPAGTAEPTPVLCRRTERSALCQEVLSAPRNPGERTMTTTLPENTRPSFLATASMNQLAWWTTMKRLPNGLLPLGILISGITLIFPTRWNRPVFSQSLSTLIIWIRAPRTRVLGLKCTSTECWCSPRFLFALRNWMSISRHPNSRWRV